MAAAVLIAAATACSSEESTKVFNAGGESTTQEAASSPGSSGRSSGNANAAGLDATQTATAAAASDGDGAAGRKGEEGTRETAESADDAVAEKIGDLPANPRPSPRPSSVPSPGLSPGPRATPSGAAKTEPPLQLARSADEPVSVRVIQPEDVPRQEREPAAATPAGTGGTRQEPSTLSRTTPRTPSPRPSGATAGGWGSPAVAEDFGGEALRLTGGDVADLSGTSVQRYGRWEIRLRADGGALPVALLRSGEQGAGGYETVRYDEPRYEESRYGESRYGEPRYGEPRYGESRYDDAGYADPRYGDSRYGDSPYSDSRYGDSGYADPRYGDSRYGDSRYGDSRHGRFRDDGAEYGDPWHGAPRSEKRNDTGTQDAAIGVAALGDAGGRRAELSVRQGRETARAVLAADFTQWHTITVDWLPGRVTFWLDGRQVWNYTGPYVPRAQGMSLALRNDGSGGAVYVDWVRVYRAPAQQPSR